MALSPNYGWSEPDNSSLVKNGAADIRTLGDAIDTSVWNVGYGQAGKNKIINGDFGIWQRGTSFTNPNGALAADRFVIGNSIAVPTFTVTQQTFTTGTAPVAGYESKYFMRLAVTAIGSSGGQFVRQNIEDVRTFAGQTMTVSFWAKYDTTRDVIVSIVQQFGSGGSAAVASAGQTISVNSGWARYSATFAVPSISGKTIGTSSYLEINIKTAAANYTFDIWGVQAEYGSQMTPFQTASGGSIQGELAMCQRYYVTGGGFFSGNVTSGSVYYYRWDYPTTMRGTPTGTIAINGDDGFNAATIAVHAIDANSLLGKATSDANTNGGYYSFTATASAEL